MSKIITLLNEFDKYGHLNKEYVTYLTGAESSNRGYINKLEKHWVVIWDCHKENGMILWYHLISIPKGLLVSKKGYLISNFNNTKQLKGTPYKRIGYFTRLFYKLFG